MKYIYKIKSFNGRRFAAMLILVATIFCNLQTWAADYGFKNDGLSENTWSVQFGYNGTNWVQYGMVKTGYSGDATLGTVTSNITLDNYHGWSWGKAKHVILYAKTKYNNDDWPESFDNVWSADDYGEGDRKFEVSPNKTLFTFSECSPGNYQYQYYLQVNGDGYRDEEYGYCSNNGNNMWMKFTIPGFIVSNYDFGVVVKSSSAQTHSYTFNSYGWTPAHLRLSGNSAITFDNGSTSLNPAIYDDEATVTLKLNRTVAGVYSSQLDFTGYIGDDPSTTPYTASATITAVVGTVEVIEGAAPVTATTSATLCGYLKQYDCMPDLYENGFYVWKSDEDEPDDNHPAIQTTYKNPLTTGSTWTGIVAGLTPGATYYYRPYVKKTTSPDYVFRSATRYTFTLPDCDYAIGDTIYYTIDASKSADICNLIFPDIASAKAHLSTRTAWINPSNHATEPNKLLKHIVFQVAPGEYGSAPDDESIIDLSKINEWDSEHPAKQYTPSHKFIIRALNEDAKPTLYGLDILNSRNITVNNLIIKRYISNPEHSDYSFSTIIAGTGNTSNDAGAGTMTNANIRITNCDIDGEGFCIMHIDDADGLYMENNNLKATRPEYTGESLCNAVVWGASMKFMNVKNANIQRNNFRGEHATNLLIQGSNHVLLMNNVFWNDNSIIDTSHPYLSFIRLLAMNGTDDDAHHLTNIGIYYNTFYLKPNGLNISYKCDYFRLGGAAGSTCSGEHSASQTANTGQYIPAGIEFMYNNCYSRSAIVNGRGSFGQPTFLDKSESLFTKIKYNNFWSEYDAPDAEESVFAIGTETTFIKVPDIMCKTVPDDPNGLVIKGGDLNLGSAITTDISGLGAEKIRTDRTGEKNIRIRLAEDRWTYGAYQQLTSESDVHVIYWNGGTSTDWDNRYNWVKEDGSTLTCVDVLAADLKVVIPAKNSTQYPVPPGGITRFPALSEWTDLTTGEEVRANIQEDHGSFTASEFAHTIEIEYGGAIVGVEHLGAKGSTTYYTDAISNFTAPRNRWVLVGAILNPNSGGSVRYICSNDYFYNHLPEVYMQHVRQDGDDETGYNIVMGVPFSSLYEDVLPTTCFGIKIPDEYTNGTARKYPASRFNARFGTNYDPKEPIKYPALTGRLINEASTPSFTMKGSDTDGGWNFLTNTYPANLKPDKLKAVLGENYNLYVYVYNDGWQPEGNWSATDYIRPQNGFVVRKTTSGSATVTLSNIQQLYDYTTETSVPGLRRASADTRFLLRAENLLSSMGSRLSVVYGGTCTDALVGVDADAPVIYVPDGGKRYGVMSIDDESSIIPVSVLNQSGAPFHIKFTLMNNVGFESIVLEDRLEGKTYNLTDGDTPVFYGLAAGVTEGRFYININYADMEDPGVSTKVMETEDVTSAAATIDIYSRERTIIVSSASTTVLEQIYVTDMAGRTFKLTPDGGNYSEHTLNLSSGVYTVHVVGDNATATKKVIIK